MSQREKVMLGVVVGALLIMLNMFLISYFLKNNASLHADLASNEGKLRSLQILLQEAPLWQQRSAWIKATQPKLENSEKASVQLHDDVLNVASKSGITLEDPQFPQMVYKPDYTAVSMKIGAKGDWKQLLDFFGGMQAPDKFIAFETALLTVDPQNQTKMQASLAIDKWYAPKPGKSSH